MQNVTRRGFVAGTAAGLAALGTAGPALAAPVTVDQVEWAAEYDAVVVGAGGAGLGAAIELAAGGLRTLAIEFEASTVASNTSLCGGVVMAAPTPVQAEMGFEGDSAENFKNYIAAASGDLAYLDLLNQWADRSAETFQWLVDMGVPFPAEYLYYSGQEQSFPEVAEPFPRGHIAEGHIGATITNVMYDKAVEAGVEFLFDLRADELVVDGDGRVVGVGVGGTYYGAAKGVILSSGGFSRNKDMLKSFIPEMLDGGSFGSSHQQGDGIAMGLKVGAKIGNMWAVQAKCTGTYLTDEKCPCNTVHSWGMPCVIVTEDGERGWAEDTFYEKQYGLIAAQPNSCVYIVWDQAVTDLGNEVVSVPPMSVGLEEEVAARQLYKADTLEELAEQIGLPVETFVATMARYNEMAAAGVDEDFGKVSGLGTVDHPPYYACKSIPAICDTAGGLVVDLAYEVLDNFDEPIPGLYAAGATTAGWRGVNYVGSGTAVSYAITSGRIAAQSLMAADPDAWFDRYTYAKV